MLAFINFLAFFAAEAGHGEAAAHSNGGGFTEFYNTYLNYPGFEAWKFINLAIFVGVLVYLIRKPLGNAFKTKRESIRQELIRAKQERDAALAKLAEVEARFATLDQETADIQTQSAREAESEAARIAEQTAADVEKLRDNARREIEAASAGAKRELKRFSADESVRLAEEILRGKLNQTDAAQLVNQSINGLTATKNGGAR